MPWCRWSPLVLHQQPGPHSFMLPHIRVNRVSVVPHRRADRSCGSSTLEAYWLQLRAASVKLLKLICSSPGAKSTCTLNSTVDLDSADGVRAHNIWMYCTSLLRVRVRVQYSYGTGCNQ